ncbi:glutamine--fructose-6-phosphate transaminase (isomerizing) [Candidatus Nanosyncoccus alces]|uniref:Glutamine--fructose-6-phosphate aminotransferase [isomerizing] n=1 Tax=Candidatus Nanosyncoccus alces TaxID=2171997 RepID=A0ABY0FLS3_9BACT|nr:glutamine--fructose-6-phosphate transaminase (isomerizing) [Candidatus Nanosyncoccus alces]RYC74767.1 Glutamine--fructose-6-phosphate aminotransferase [isomerizing] [Candidatus Nanosyncoccus alces]
MCGIVGYVGKGEAQGFLLSGLKRLEYRGYDSAGIVTIAEDGTATLIRAKGKIANLEEKLAKSRRSDKIGIGHTRWATHGEPSEENAHPHKAGDIYLVHNGIIENYKELKKTLTEHKFESETDSEVLAALVNSFYKDGKYPLVNAVVQALKLVQGTYGIAVVSSKNPEEIVVARSGSPLVIGIGNDETLIASDASALVGHTKRAIYLNDGEVARLTKNSIEVKTLNSEPVSAKVEEIETNLAAIQKGGYEHFLLKEIVEQPNSLKETLRGRVNVENGTVHLGGPGLTEAELRKIKHLIIVGCGTAYHAGLLAGYYIEQFTPEITIETVIASEYRYRSAYIPKDAVALIVSQSGETADTLACLREIKKQGIKTIGIVNAIGSTIAREVDGGTYVHVGPEISVASTKAFTSQAIAMVMFGLTIAQAKGVKPGVLRPYVEEIAKLPEEIGKVLSGVQPEVEEIAKKYADYDHAIYLGRDTAYPTAMEGALKLKEISYVDANAYAFGELKHGPLALVDDRFFELALLPKGALYDKAISNVQEVLARGGHVIAVTNVADFDMPVEGVVKITTDIEMFAPVLMNLVSQLFAYYMTIAKGYNVDQPRNLAKSVTVE